MQDHERMMNVNIELTQSMNKRQDEKDKQLKRGANR